MNLLILVSYNYGYHKGLRGSNVISLIKTFHKIFILFKLKKYFYLFYEHKCFMCLYVSSLHACLVPVGTEATGSPRTGFTDGL